MSSKEKPLSLFVLLKLFYRADERFKSTDIVQSHNVIVEKHGSVWFGKSGRRLSKNLNDEIKAAIKDKQAPKMILLCPKNGQRDYYIANLLSVKTNKTPELHRIPEYYRSMREFITQWFEIGELKKLPDKQLDDLIVRSSKRPLKEIAHGQAPYMSLMLQSQLDSE